MSDEERTNGLLEMYKIHAQAADDVSRRRDSANRMHLGATTSIGIALAIITRFGTGEVPEWVVVIVLCTLGGLVQLGWLGAIQSYRQLNQHKFSVLLEMEKELPFAFYTKEYDAYGRGSDGKLYRELTKVEKRLPWCFLGAFTIVGIAAAGWAAATNLWS